MKERVTEALADLATQFGDGVTHQAREDGGAIVCIRAVDLGVSFRPPQADLWFIIPPNFGDAPIYPTYLHPQVAHVNGASLPFQSIELDTFEGKLSVTQVSLSSPRWKPGETALSKILSVLHWLRSR